MVADVAILRALRHFAPIMVLSATAAFGLATTPPTLAISNETAPPGGWAQIKIYAAKPMAIASGHLVLTLNPTAFGTGAMVGLFGANADAMGLATTTGAQIDVQFTSATSGIGQLAGLPVIVISVPVLASAAGMVTVSATSPDSSVTVASGSVMIQGTLSVQKIYAGMGVVPAGTVVPVYGSGFTPTTTVAIDGVEIASTKFVSASEVDVTLGGATELVGKRVRVTDGGVEFDYFCFQPDDPVNASAFASLTSFQPLFPLSAGTGFGGYISEIGGFFQIQNPNTTPVSVVVSDTNACCGAFLTGVAAPFTIPAGSWAIFAGDDDSDFVVSADVPVRVMAVNVCHFGTVPTQYCPSPPGPFDSAAVVPLPPALTPAAVTFAWQMGSSIPPAPRTVSINASYVVALTASVASGGSWLSVSLPSPFAQSMTLTVNPLLLGLGTYQGLILLTQSNGPPATLPVTLTVTNTAVPMISGAPVSLSFTAPGFDAKPYSQTIAVTSDSGPTAFTVRHPTGVGGYVDNVDWLKVSPLSGTTPATLTVTWDPAVTEQFYYQQRSTTGSITISGPGNDVTIPATFNVTGVQTFQTYLGLSGTGPAGLVFSAQTGSASQTQTINVDPQGSISAVANQPWMTLVVPTANNTVLVTVNPNELVPGVYTGTVTISEAGIPSIAVPVTFGVWSTPPKLTTTVGSYTFVQTVGEPAVPYQSAEVDSGGVPVNLTFALGASWLNVVDYYYAPTPTSIHVGLANPPGLPGQYDGSFTIESPGSSVYVPVTLLVEPGPVTPPVVSQVVNGASGIASGVSPGEILTIRGYSVGAAAVSGIRLDPSGAVVSQSNGIDVTFDGQAAPLLYTSANQTNLVVPYEVTGKTSTVMQVTYAAAAGTFRTNAWALPVVAAAPGVFTVDATGAGQGAIVNQDGTVNSAANPAARGSVVSIYATGEGQTSPPGVTGSVTASGLKTPLQQVTVTIGGIGSSVQYAGSAPESVAGLLQVNAVVPQGASPGSAVPVLVNVGGTPSQAGVTIAVK
jgi:uncharacterized protein (TIGR03437 family)